MDTDGCEPSVPLRQTLICMGQHEYGVSDEKSDSLTGFGFRYLHGSRTNIAGTGVDGQGHATLIHSLPSTCWKFG